MKSLRFAILASLLALLAPTANAIECHDARVTNAIKLAAGRMPNPGECNLANYRVLPGHTQFESVVKEALLAIQKEPANGRLPSQKLGRLPDVIKKTVN